ncbi:MAG: hypothetical protein ACW99A_06270 [Candidatus Kariarchaeaceae archaeon]|jgi:hypothetical protein
MRIFSVYVINDNGLCLYNRSFTAEAPPYSLITGLLTAMQNFVLEVTGSYPTDLSAGGFTFHMEKYGPLTIVLTTQNQKVPIPTLSDLGYRFLNRFGEKVENWKGRVSEFEEFDADIEDILGTSRIQKRVDPKQPLTSLALLSLNPDLQNVAQAIIQIGEASSYRLAQLSGQNEYVTRLQCEELVKLGHLGRIHSTDDEFIYFTR